MQFVQKLERKFGKYAIRNLMMYVIVLYVIGWIIQIINPEYYTIALAMDVEKILHGQVWRLVTFIIMPPEDSSAIFMVFTLYLYYILGTNLERVWGAFRFNLYFFMGVFFHIVAAFVVYFAFGENFPITTYYLNLSLFLAFAVVYPDMELYLFFILPIKIKWLGILDAVYFGVTIVAGYMFYFDKELWWSIAVRLAKIGIIALPDVATAALVSMVNFLVFFFLTRNYRRISPAEISRRQKYKRSVSKARDAASGRIVHKCAICGRTNQSHPDLSFRYCSKCNGNYEYCEEHIFTHQHVE